MDRDRPAAAAAASSSRVVVEPAAPVPAPMEIDRPTLRLGAAETSHRVNGTRVEPNDALAPLLERLEKAVTNRARVECLLELNNWHGFAQLAAADLVRLVEALQNELHGAPSAQVVTLLVRLLAKAALCPGCDWLVPVDDIMGQLNAASSPLVRQVALAALERVAMVRADARTRARLVAAAAPYLCDGDAWVRRTALSLHSQLGDGVAAMDTVVQHSQDGDARVREAALTGALMLHQRGVAVPLSAYGRIIVSLNDDFEAVRMEAMRVLWVMSTVHGQHTLPDRRLRLVDDVFVRICNMVNDISVSVRTSACRLLGMMRGVSERFLLQTFSKQVIKRGKIIETSDPSAVNPQGDADVRTLDEISFLDSGAAGAFIHGLEDERMDVRLAAVNSIRIQSLQSPSFRDHSVAFLIDMFNDEIDQVRVASIHAVQKQGASVTLSEEQLQVVLAILEDASSEVRQATRALLGATKMANIACVHASIQAMLANLARNPQDRDDIFATLARLGEHHAVFAEFIVEDLLRTRTPFLTKEPIADEPVHVALLIFVFNAVAGNATIVALLPEYALRHFPYLRDQYRSLFPALRFEAVLARVRTMEHDGAQTATAAAPSPSSLAEMWRQCVEQLAQATPDEWGRGQHAHIERILAACAHNMERIRGYDQGAAYGSSGFYLRYLALMRTVLQVVRVEGRVFDAEVAHDVVRQSYALQHRFSGLAPATALHLMELRVWAHQMLLLTAGDEQSRHPVDRCTLEERVAAVDEFCRAHALAVPAAVVDAVTDRSVARVLAFRPQLVQLESNEAREVRARITAPVPTGQHPLDAPSSVPLRLNVEAEVDGIADLAALRVEVVLPDGSVQRTAVLAQHATQVGAQRWLLRMPLAVHQRRWCGRTQLRLAVVRLHPADAPTRRQQDLLKVSLLDGPGEVAIPVAPQDGVRDGGRS